MTAAAMFALATGKKRIGISLNSAVLMAESRVTFVDAILASAVLVGLALNAFVGWWWADPATGYLIVYYAIREARSSLRR
jgi:divalent metal cation (Fe/Co/Zn/Cd) transporter